MFIRNMLLPLDRKYAVTTTGVRSLWDLGLHYFRHKVAGQPEIQRKTLIAILHQIQAERFVNFSCFLNFGPGSCSCLLESSQKWKYCR